MDEKTSKLLKAAEVILFWWDNYDKDSMGWAEKYENLRVAVKEMQQEEKETEPICKHCDDRGIINHGYGQGWFCSCEAGKRYEKSLDETTEKDFDVWDNCFMPTFPVTD